MGSISLTFQRSNVTNHGRRVRTLPLPRKSATTVVSRLEVVEPAETCAPLVAAKEEASFRETSPQKGDAEENRQRFPLAELRESDEDKVRSVPPHYRTPLRSLLDSMEWRGIR